MDGPVLEFGVASSASPATPLIWLAIEDGAKIIIKITDVLREISFDGAVVSEDGGNTSSGLYSVRPHVSLLTNAAKSMARMIVAFILASVKSKSHSWVDFGARNMPSLYPWRNVVDWQIQIWIIT